MLLNKEKKPEKPQEDVTGGDRDDTIDHLANFYQSVEMSGTGVAKDDVPLLQYRFDESVDESSCIAIGAKLYGHGKLKNKRPHTFAEKWWSPVSYILYFWFSGVLRLGYKRTLQYEDMFDTPAALKTKEVYPRFCDTFNSLIVDARRKGGEDAAKVKEAEAGRSARQQGLEFPSSEITKAYLYAMGMFLGPVVGTLGASQANRVAIGTQVMIRGELIASIYRKALSLSTRSRQATETGRIVNFMSADVNQLQMFFYPFASQLLTGPAMLITALVLLWFQIEWATFIGLGILLISTPATTIF
eukprot:jgi/Picre1/27388/NNA_000355.t1